MRRSICLALPLIPAAKGWRENFPARERSVAAYAVRSGSLRISSTEASQAISRSFRISLRASLTKGLNQ